jgi:hypothetical protein
MFFRLIRFLYSAYPSFGVVFQTLQRAYPEILTFIFIIVVTFLGVALMGHAAFGWFSTNYYYLEDSLFTLYDMFLGTYEYESICQVYACPSITPFFFISFMFIFNFILLNVFLCIIRANYYETKLKKQMSNEAFAMIAADDSKNFYKKLENLILFKNPEDVEKEENPKSKNDEEEDNEKNNNEKDKIKSETNLWKTFQYHFSKLNITEFCSGSTMKKEEIIEAKKKKYKEIRKKKLLENINLLVVDYNKEFDQILDFINYFVYLICFLSLIFMQLSSGVSDSIVSYTKNFFENTFDYESNFKDFEESKNLIDKIINAFYRNNSDQNINSKFESDIITNYVYLNPPYFRITFRRYLRISNSENYENKYFPSTIEDNSPLGLDNCGGNSEYKRTIALKNKYMNYLPPGNNTAYGMCGGYVFWFDHTSPYISDKLNDDWNLKEFFEIMFTSDLASYVLDTAIFNKYYEYVVYLSIRIRRGFLGKIEYTLETDLIPINRYISLHDFKRLVLEIIYLGFVIYYTFLLFREFYIHFKIYLDKEIEKSEKDDIETNIEKKDSYCKRFFRFDIDKYHKDKGLSLVFKLCCDFTVTLIKRIFQLVFIFFFSLIKLWKQDFSNLLQFVSLTITYFMIYDWYKIITYTSLLEFTFSEEILASKSFYNLPILNTINLYYSEYNYWQAVNAVLIFFLVIRNLKFSRSIYMQITIISRSISAFLFHLLFMLLVFIGFSFWAYSLYAQTLKSFSNIPLVLLNLLLLAFTNISFYKDFTYADEMFASIFTILFTICFVLILTNVLYSIIIESFSELKLLQSQNKSEYKEVSTFEILKNKAKNFSKVIRDYCNNLEICNLEIEKIEEKYEKSKKGVIEDLKKNKTSYIKSIWENIVQTTQMKLKYFEKLGKIINFVKNATLEGEKLKEEDFQDFLINKKNKRNDKFSMSDLTIMNKIVSYILIEILKLKSQEIEEYFDISFTNTNEQDLIRNQINSQKFNEDHRSNNSNEQQKDDMKTRLIYKFGDKYKKLINEKLPNFFDKKFRKLFLMRDPKSNKIEGIKNLENRERAKSLHCNSGPEKCDNCKKYYLYKNEMRVLVYDIILKYLYIPKEMTNYEVNLMTGHFLYVYDIDDVQTPSKTLKSFQEPLKDIRLKLLIELLSLVYCESIYEDFKHLKKSLEKTNECKDFKELLVYEYLDTEEKVKQINDSLKSSERDEFDIQLYKMFIIWDSLCIFFFSNKKTLIREVRNKSQYYPYLEHNSNEKFVNFFRQVHGLDNRKINEKFVTLHEFPYDQAINKNLHDHMLEKENFINYQSFVYDQSIISLEKLMLLESTEIQKNNNSYGEEKLEKLNKIMSNLWDYTEIKIEKFCLFFGYNNLISHEKVNLENLPKLINQNEPSVSFYMEGLHQSHLLKVKQLPENFSKELIKNIKNAIIENEINDEKKKFQFIQDNLTIQKLFSYLSEVNVHYIVLGKILKKSFKKYLARPKKIIEESIEKVQFIKQKTELLNPENKYKYKEFYQLLQSKITYESLVGIIYLF